MAQKLPQTPVPSVFTSERRDKTQQAAQLLVCFFTLLLTGCETFEMPKWDLFEEKKKPDQQLVLPDYEHVAKQYNANLTNLHQLWSRALISVRFVDEAGNTRREQGDGHFIFVLPNQTALSLGKLGRVLFWFGSNESQYWVIDLMNDPSVAYIGTTEQGRATLDRQGIGITPQEMLRVVGALPLPTDEQTQAKALIEDFQGNLLVDLPTASLRLLLEPNTLRPKRIDLLNPYGESVVIARLDRHEPIETEGVAPGGWPHFPTDITLQLVGTDGEMRIQLSDPSDGKRFNRIRPAAFDVDRLIRAYRPDETIHLDAENTP